MSQGPDFTKPDPEQPRDFGAHPGYGPPPGTPPPAPGSPPPYQGQGYAPPPGYQQPYPGAPAAFGPGPDAPYGVHPVTGIPYSDKSKLAAGLLQLLIPCGIGRMYMGDTQTGVIQLVVTLVTCGLGGIWPFIDGILILVGDYTDQYGRPLRG